MGSINVFSRRGWVVLLLMLGVSSSSAYQELFRADFNDLPVESTAQADFGTITSQSFANVYYQSLFFPTGFTTNWMRINPSGAFSQVWTLAEQAQSGECALMWRMHLMSAMPGGQSVSVSPLFRTITGPAELPIVVDFRTDGAITVDFKPATATWSPGVVYQYALTVDLSTGYYELWQNTNRIAFGHTAQPIHQRMTWTRILLAASGTYPGTIDIDNIYAVNARPFVSYGWMDFESEPLYGTLPLGPFDGYPLGDRVIDRDNDLSDSLESIDEASSRRLRMRNGIAPALSFQLTNDVGRLPDGLYRFSFDYRQAASNGTLSARIMGGTTAKTIFSFDDGLATLNSNLYTMTYPSASIALPSNTTLHVELWSDTVADTHDLIFNGSVKAVKWPNFSTGRPTRFDFYTESGTTPFMYLDNIAIERRASESVIALSQTAPIRRLVSYRPASRINDIDTVLSTNLIPADMVYGADRLLYVSDPINRQIAVFDPDNLMMLTSRTYSAWFSPYGLSAQPDGTILALVQSNSVAAHVYPVSPYPDLIPGSASVIANLSINTEQIEAGGDRSRLYILKDYYPHTSTVLVYSASTFIKTGELISGGVVGRIKRIHVGPDDTLYVAGTGTVRFAAIDVAQDTVKFVVTDTNNFDVVWDIGTLPNGDVLGVDNHHAVALFSHYHGERIATYSATNMAGSHAFSRVIAPPDAAIQSFALPTSSTAKMGIDTDYHRYYTIERATQLGGPWSTVVTDLLATNRTDHLSFSNSGHDPMRFFRFIEAGWE